MSDMEFVTIDLSKKEVNYDSAWENKKNGKVYVSISAPGGGVFIYPLERLKENEENEKRVHFSCPVGTEITLSFSERNPDVPDDAPASEKYVNSTRVVKIEDLKEMYKQERAAYAKSIESGLIELGKRNILEIKVSEKLIRNFNKHDGKPLVSVSIPVYDEEQKKEVFYSIVIPEYRVSDAEKEGQKKISILADHEFTAKRGVLDKSSGKYNDVELKLSGTEIDRAFKDSKKRYAEQFINESIQNEKNEQAAQEQTEGNFRHNNRNRRGR